MKRFTTVDEFMAGVEYWQEELLRLREILPMIERGGGSNEQYRR